MTDSMYETSFIVLCLCSFVSVGVIYHGSKAVPGTAGVVHKLKKLVHSFNAYI